MASYLENAAEIAQEAGQLLQGLLRSPRLLLELKGEHDSGDRRRSRQREADRRPADRALPHPRHSGWKKAPGTEGLPNTNGTSDPLDGTTNFAHGFPIYNVTLGLERAGELIAGVIVDPIRQEVFTAEKGSGRVSEWQADSRVQRFTAGEDAVGVTGFPSRKRHQNVNVHFFYQLSMMSHGVRRLRYSLSH